MQKFEIVWRAPEFEYRDKSVSWHWLSVIAAVIILSFAIWEKNFLFGVFIVLAEILIIVWAGREPKTFDFRLDDRGLAIGGNNAYAFSSLQSFGVKDDGDENWIGLMFVFKRGFKPPIKIKAPRQKMSEIEKMLKQFLPQAEYEESFLETLEKLFGF